MLSFYVDENLQGKRFVGQLRSNGLTVATAADLGLVGEADAVWIPYVTKRGFVILTADRAIRLVPAEKEALLRTGARIVAVKVGGSKTLEMIASNVINSHHAIERFDSRNEAPWFVVLQMPDPKDFALNRSGRIRKKDL